MHEFRVPKAYLVPRMGSRRLSRPFPVTGTGRLLLASRRVEGNAGFVLQRVPSKDGGQPGLWIQSPPW